MAPNDHRRAYALLGIVLAVVLVGLTRFAISYLRLEKAAILNVATPGLGCPADQIDVGPSYQYNDEPSRIAVSGCGKSGTVLCDERSPVDEPYLTSLKARVQCRFLP